MKELIAKLNKASAAYYAGNPIMSDQEYDLLFEELQRKEREDGYVMSNSPTVNVGTAPVAKLPKIRHEHLMLSLAKAHTAKEIGEFSKGKDLAASLKMDGLTVSATYEGGKLTRLETRGNGEEGNDIMVHAASFENLPIYIDGAKFDELVVDGEAIIDYKSFDSINEKLPINMRYKNPRNLAAGTLNLLDPAESAKRHLKFVAWDLISMKYKGKDIRFISFGDKMTALSEAGFTVVPYKIGAKFSDVEFLRQQSKFLGYPIDGIVFTYNSVSFGESLGVTAHHFNKSIAYKFEDDLYETRIRSVEWTMGKTGALTPVANFDVVEIDGTDVAKASMHNISVLEQLHPKLNCTAYIYKANQIIPQVHHCDDNGDADIVAPKKCPYCGGATAIKKDHESKVLICKNPQCSGKKLGLLTHFCSQNAMNIDGLSEAKLSLLLDRGYISSASDIYKLKEHEAKLKRINGWGAKSVDNLLAAIEKSREVKLENFINALSIPNVGYNQAKLIAKYCKNKLELFERVLKGKMDITRIYGIGNVIQSSINDWYLENNEEYSLLLNDININDVAEVVDIKTRTLSGKKFCITGKLSKFKNRDALVADIESYGGTVVSTVNKLTSFLINNDKASISSKNKKAHELNVPVISEEDYLKISRGQ